MKLCSLHPIRAPLMHSPVEGLSAELPTAGSESLLGLGMVSTRVSSQLLLDIHILVPCRRLEYRLRGQRQAHNLEDETFPGASLQCSIAERLSCAGCGRGTEQGCGGRRTTRKSRGLEYS